MNSSESKPMTAEETRKRIAELMKEVESEEHRHPGLRCPKCGCSMVHERLNGYRCIRGCQP